MFPSNIREVFLCNDRKPRAVVHPRRSMKFGSTGGATLCELSGTLRRLTAGIGGPNLKLESPSASQNFDAALMSNRLVAIRPFQSF